LAQQRDALRLGPQKA
jgi:AraC-like DNA-binding protein